MLQIHPNARTTPAVRTEIARSEEPTGLLAQRYGVSAETIRKWRQRGVEDCFDHSARPRQLPWKATEEERAVVCALRRSTNFARDDLTFVVTHFPPHLNRDSIWRIRKAEGLNRRPPPVSSGRAKGTGKFKEYDLFASRMCSPITAVALLPPSPKFVRNLVRSTATRSLTRLRRMVWSSALTAGSVARCW